MKRKRQVGAQQIKPQAQTMQVQTSCCANRITPKQTKGNRATHHGNVGGNDVVPAQPAQLRERRKDLEAETDEPRKSERFEGS